MKKNNLLSFAAIAAVTLLNTGCSVFQIGESDFACDGKPNGSLCKGPMEVYELTHNRDNLDHLMISREKLEEIKEHNEKYDHPQGFIHEDNITRDHGSNDQKDSDYDYDENSYDNVYDNTAGDSKNSGNKGVYDSEENYDYDHEDESCTSCQGSKKTTKRKKSTAIEEQDINIYEQRSFDRQSNGNYQEATLISARTSEEKSITELSQLRQGTATPYNMAPEALAALKPPKVLRILVFPWTDEEKNLHLQGYIYKKIEDERWIVGNQVNHSSKRIIPIKMVRDGNKNTEQQKTDTKGVDPMNVQRLNSFNKSGFN